MKVTYIDPPKGWKYGFPKPIKEGESYKQILIDSGYPEDQIEFAMKYSRMWTEEVKDEE